MPPGALKVEADQAETARFHVHPWSPRPSFLVIHGLGDQAPEVQINGQTVSREAPNVFLADRGTLVLQLVGQDSNLVLIKK